MKRKVLFMALCMSVMLSACGSDNQETEVPEDTTISVDESELVPVKPIVETSQDMESVSENNATEFKNEFVSLSQMTESLDIEPFKTYCTIVKNDFYALSLQSVENKDYFLDVIIPDQEFAMSIMDMESDIEFFPEYKPASKEDADFYNDYTWREFIEIRPGSGFFESGEDTDVVLQDETNEELTPQPQDEESPEGKEPQELTQTDLEPQEVENTEEDYQKEQPEVSTDIVKENTEEIQEDTEIEQNENEVEKYNYPVYELTGISLKFGNQKSSLITNAEQLQQVLSEMGY